MASDGHTRTGAGKTASRGQVLVAIMNNLRDFDIARDQHWYRIPVRSVQRCLRERWPPIWLAFYQTKVFGPECWAINYYADVRAIRTVSRRALLPQEPDHLRADELYHKIEIGPLERLPEPILSRRLRRVVFIPTDWDKFISAVEINDLYDESPLEDRLWAEFKRHEIAAERQFFISVKTRRYALDFAIFCDGGEIDVETDGDSWHADAARIPLDNQRDNDLAGAGWLILRFNGRQIRESATEYCVPAVMETINRLGGLQTESMMPRTFDPDHPEAPRQLALFESGPDYDVDSW
jgi:very-short-patch-repair endonuclease